MLPRVAARVTALEFRRALRRAPTEAEEALWKLLRSRRLGEKFRRQRTIGPYTVDFVCLERRLVVELDGGQHFLPEGHVHDRHRDAYLATMGYRVLRVSNLEVLRERDAVLEAIWNMIHAP